MATRIAFARWWKRHTHRLRRRNDTAECQQYRDGIEEPRIRKGTEQEVHFDGQCERFLSVRLK